jgi:DUF2075 family protein
MGGDSSRRQNGEQSDPVGLMQLYAGASEGFIPKAISNEIAHVLRESFHRQLGYYPGDSETKSWLISLKDLAYSMQSAKLGDTGIIVEYKLPQSSKRLDAMLLGIGEDGRDRGVIVELKQWQAAYSCGVEDCVTLSRGDRKYTKLHPSRQAGNYATYLSGMHPVFYDDNGGNAADIMACSFLHQANSRDCGDLLDAEYQTTLSDYPLYTGDRREDLEAYLSLNVGRGDGRPLLQRVMDARYMPSKQLLRHVADMIEGNPVFTLLDEQLVAYNMVRSAVRRLEKTTGRAVVLVIGGPGTGKSVIAVRLLADLARDGRNIVHCTGSKAFTTNLRAKVGRKASAVFKYFNSFAREEPGTIDVLVADEAHRIRNSSNNRFRKVSDKAQVNELIDAAKVSVFLLDDHQVVRPEEVGTPALIRETAIAAKAEVFEVRLEGQYRCAGSESYLKWLDHMFGLGGEKDLSWKDDYEFRIVDSPHQLESLIHDKAAAGASARLVAGFCWPWSKPNKDGSLVEDVEIGNWKRPWNRRETGSEPPHKHPYTIWATQDAGLGEVGCIYSAQGFEFEYCGIIVGPDLVWRSKDGGWTGVKSESHDTVVKRSKDLTRHLCNTYRVLLSRGMRGTYVHFLDIPTRKHFEEMLEIKY